jgi:hypothetical protein
MDEIWLPVPGYEGLYSVSNMGRVRSEDRITPHPLHGPQRHRGRILRPSASDKGYLNVSLSKLGKIRCLTIAPTVCRIFNGPPPSDEHEVNHKSGKKENNCADNLEWVTASENKRHALRLGLCQLPPGRRKH